MLTYDSQHSFYAQSTNAMTDFPISNYTNNDIERAGKIIADGNLRFKGEIPPEIQKAFLIANNWRDAHAYPMRSIHASLRYYMQANKLKGITAARLKRMQAIRRKLPRIKLGLDQLQDLGGCRVILPTIADVHRLVNVLKERLPSKVDKEDNYILKPKRDGYRSHHLIFRFRKKKPTLYDGKRIELQIRTRLQHSWATAIEAVGLYRGEELKNGQGNSNWLRLFLLMSAEFAETEQCPVPPSVPEQKERISEIKKLAFSLGAIEVLDSISNGFKGPDTPLAPGYKPSHYLIRYDYVKKEVRVEPYNKAINATNSYDKAEAKLRTGDDRDVVVLVEVDKINNLQKAYPNYFGDVEWFKKQLKEITLGKSVVEYTSPPKRPDPKQPPEAWIDPSWLRGTRFPKPSFKQRKKK